MRQDENSRTTDEYVTSLYNKLKLALASARDTAILEAHRQKWHYNRKAGAVELHLGDKVLVKLDAFRGQRRKLKNRWGDALYTVVKHVADGIPAYEVENDANKIRTLPYHPQMNGTIKRVHQTLRRMIAKMDPEKRAKWPSHLGPILIAYNVTRSLITGYSPYFLMFGHRPRLPVDLLFPTMRWDENSLTTDEYVTSLYDKLKLALVSARDTAILEAHRQKQHYNHKAGAVELHLGDKVLVKPDAFRGQRRKLKNRWGDALYTVVKHLADGIPAYEVENDANNTASLACRT